MLSLLTLCLASISPVFATPAAGSFAAGGNTLISAMMMFVGNDQKVYILDKAEGNAAQINGHPAWGAVWDIQTHQAQPMDVRTNVFCSSGMHLPNGSFVSFGGNGAVGPGGGLGSQLNPGGFSASWDSTYQDFDGTKAIRLLNPCDNSDDFNSPQCTWFDEPDLLSMKTQRWYSTAEATGDGSIVIIGGMTAGGYINRATPNVDPAFQNGGANPTYEFYPPIAADPPVMNFMVTTSGLNAYPHAFMMPSGKMFVQANLSSVLWDFNANVETALPPMPNGVVRVYPASGAVAMLPLTPQNNWTPTILFCGGSNMPDAAWGNYSFPAIDTWNYPASQDCQRITPEPTDGSSPQYVQDDNLLEGRTMGQFIILPNGKLLVVNGGLNGTAGYSQATGQTSNFADMPWGESLASGPVGTPAIYDPNAPAGSRWSNAGLGTSQIARLYHSSAMLLPDASVLIAGSNPNMDVNTSTIFPTQYQAEIFYPPYFSASVRPAPTGIPQSLTYGGNSFDITIPATSYSGVANDAADSATVVVYRGGFTTHAMNMGQRYLQLNNTYTVNQDGSITLHTAQLPPNPKIFQPGPAFVYVNVHGIPSNGTYVIVGSGQIGTQPTAASSVLPPNVRLDNVNGTAGASNTPGNGSDGAGSTSATKSNGLGAIVGGTVAGLAGVAILGAIIGAIMVRRRRAESARRYAAAAAAAGSAGGAYAMANAGAGVGGMGSDPNAFAGRLRVSDSSAFIPLAHDNDSAAWNASTASLAGPGVGPYRDNVAATGSHGMSIDDPYMATPMQPYGSGGGGYGAGGRHQQGYRF